MRRNKMTVIVIVAAVVLSMLCSACGNTEPEELTAQEIVDQLYEQDFNYTKVEIKEVKADNSVTRITYLGEYTHQPYQEHIVIDYDNSDADDSLWSEVTYSGSGDTVSSEILTDDGYVTQSVERQYLNGYGEDMSLAFVEETELDDTAVSLYRGEYSVDFAAMYGYEDDITAVVTLDFYIDMAANHIEKIVTDMSDYNMKLYIANYIDGSSEPRTYNDAVAYYQDHADEVPIVTEEITFYNYE